MTNPTPADLFRDQLDRLGLGQRQLARLYEVNERTVRRWATGDQPIPLPVMAALCASEPGALAYPDEADEPCV